MSARQKPGSYDFAPFRASSALTLGMTLALPCGAALAEHAPEAAAPILNAQPQVSFATLAVVLALLFLAVAFSVWFALKMHRQNRELLAAQNSMQRARSDMSRALLTIPEPVLIVDLAKDQVLYANNAFLQLFQYADVDEVKAVSVRKLVQISKPVNPPGADLIQHLHRCMEEGRFTPMEWTFNCDDPHIPTMVYANAVEFEERQCLIVTMKDLTLENERTQALTRIAEKEKEANQLKSRFLMNMSHEIRTPMNAIIGFSQVALRKPQTLENTDIFKKIFTSAQNLISIMGDVLDFSKIESEMLDLNYTEFSVEDMIQNAFSIAAQRIMDKKVEMLLDMNPEVPYYVIGDKTRVWQVLKNVLDNAAKFTEEGRVVLSVDLVEEKSDDGNATLRFKVSDTGIGMSEEQLTKMFLPFHQPGHNKSEINIGSGLGMAIIRELLTLMGGDIQIESKLGEGTAVQVEIPFRRSEKRATLRNVIGGTDIRSNSVLIADDDEYACQIMKNLLALLGIEPVIVHNGADAILKVKEQENKGDPYKIIIVDYMLGADNGLEIARRMKHITANQSKILMISAYTKLLIEEEIHEIGFVDVIEKPFVPSQFIQCLNNAIDADIPIENRRYHHFPGARVLLCEDNPINQEVAKGVLEVFSIVPDVAENGREGISMLEEAEAPYDLVFMDIMMPVMDGHETTVAIRSADKAYCSVPIVSMTASVIKEEIERCQKEGMNGHLGKPLVMEDIYQVLCIHLAKYRTEPDIVVQEQSHDLHKRFELEGIDFATGVSRFAGKQEKYLETLKRFATGLKDEQPPMEVAFEEANREESVRLVHTLKGTAGNLGAMQLYEAAVLFENSHRNGMPDSALYEALWAQAKSTKRAILSILHEEQRHRALMQGEDKELAESLTDLIEALEKGEASVCESIMKKLSGTQFEACNPKDMERLNALVEDYDFPDAQELADKMLEAIR